MIDFGSLHLAAHLSMRACPKCGWRPPLAELQRLQHIHELLRGIDPDNSPEEADGDPG